MASELVQTVLNAEVDAISLSEFVFKPADFMVQRRLAPPVNTLQYYIDMFENIGIGGEFNSAKIASLTVTTSAAGTDASVVTGGTPSNRTFALTIPRGDKGDKGLDGSFTKKAYTTEALMIADKANIPANTSVDVTNDSTPSKNGTYAYDGTTFTKSTYDPLTLAKTYTDSSVKSAIDRSGAVLAHTYDPLYLPYVERGVARGDKVYFKLTEIGLHYTLPNNKTAGYKSWSSIKSELTASGGVFKTSPKGMTDTLEVFDQSIVVNLATKNFQLINRFDVKPSEHLEIATFAFAGIVRGLLFDNWVSHKDDLTRDIQFYPRDGYLDSETPYVEQVNYPLEATGGAATYIKIPSLRLRSAYRTEIRSNWDSIVADILATSSPLIGTKPIADFFQTSPKGVVNCLRLYDEALIYNVWTYKFSVVNSNYAPDPYIEVVVARNVFGQLEGGLIRDWWMNKRIGKLERKEGAGGSGNNTSSRSQHGSQTKLMAHGGLNAYGQMSPFSSMPSARLAGEYGYWGCEIDIVETKDGEWVHLHDLFLSDYVVGGTGNVKDYTLAELKQMDVSKKSAAYGWSGVNMMEFREFLDICAQYNMVAVPEFKSVPSVAAIDKVLGYIRDRMDISDVILISFSQAVLQSIRSRDSEVQLSLITVGLTDAQVDFAASLGNCDVSPKVPIATVQFNSAKAKGVDLAYWTTNQSDIDNGYTIGYKYATTDVGVHSTFNKGRIVDSVKSNDNFSNLTNITAGVASNKVLTVQTGEIYHEFNVAQGDVITSSCMSMALGAEGTTSPTIKIVGYNSLGATTVTYTNVIIKHKTIGASVASALIYDANTVKARLIVQASANSGIAIRDLRVRKIEI